MAALAPTAIVAQSVDAQYQWLYEDGRVRDFQQLLSRALALTWWQEKMVPNTRLSFFHDDCVTRRELTGVTGHHVWATRTASPLRS